MASLIHLIFKLETYDQHVVAAQDSPCFNQFQSLLVFVEQSNDCGHEDRAETLRQQRLAAAQGPGAASLSGHEKSSNAGRWTMVDGGVTKVHRFKDLFKSVMSALGGPPTDRAISQTKTELVRLPSRE